MIDNPIPKEYIKPDAPRNNWETFKWLFFEPTLFYYSSEKRASEGRQVDLKKIISIYLGFITPLAIAFYIFLILGMAFVNAPSLYPSLFDTSIDIQEWNNINGFIPKYAFLFVSLARGLLIGVVGGLIIVVASSVIFQESALFVGLSFAIGFSLSGVLLGILPGIELTIGCLTGFAFVLEGKSPGTYMRGLVIGGFFYWVNLALITLINLLNLEAYFNFKSALRTVSIWPLICYYFVQFRLPLYIFYILLFFRKYTLKINPYLGDERIWLPLPWVKKALKKESKENPLLAFHFVEFLLRYRPLQRSLAAEIEHVATVALWKSKLILKNEIFDRMLFLDIKPTDYHSLIVESIPSQLQKHYDSIDARKTMVNYLSNVEWKKYLPSVNWQNKISQIKETLISIESTTSVVTQQSLLRFTLQLVEEFEQINLRETFRGHNDYFSVIQHWQQVLANQLSIITKKVEEEHPFGFNPYFQGVVLSPEQEGSRQVFLDRNDIKDKISLKIQTAPIMPTFFLLGQRRVGKTSLLNFLPTLLDSSNYDVVSIDAQTLGGETSLVAFFEFWGKSIHSKLKIAEPNPSYSNDPLKAWDEFVAFLENITKMRQRKLILPIDEYDAEGGFHYILKANSELGLAVLGRMRAFSQSQTKIVFLFAGATHFSDLPEPKISKYFVHAQTLRIDYLSEEASLQLIERPTPDFKISYADGVAKYIYKISQGHPHLLQNVCGKLMEYASKKHKNILDWADLEYVLHHEIVLRGEQPFSVFWDEFCDQETMRNIVKAIASRQTFDQKMPEVQKLLDYGYIVPDGRESFKMRVPLFESWVRQFGY